MWKQSNPGILPRMQGFGQRLKTRAQALGLSDSEVARRLGVAQSRYANYVADAREPDLATLVKICEILGVTPTDVLIDSAADKGNASDAERISVALTSMDDDGRRVAAELIDTLAKALPSSAGDRPDTDR